MHGEERLPESLAGPVGQRRHRVGAHSEQYRHLGRLLALDLGVPQHGLPALRQRRKGLGGGGVLEALDRRVAEGHARVEGLQVLGRLHPRVRPDPVDVETADGGEQVRAERKVGTRAALEQREHLRERLRDQILGVGGRHQLPRQAPGRGHVPLEELAVGVGVPTPDGRDQLGVRGPVGTLEDGVHKGPTSHVEKDHAKKFRDFAS